MIADYQRRDFLPPPLSLLLILCRFCKSKSKEFQKPGKPVVLILLLVTSTYIFMYKYLKKKYLQNLNPIIKNFKLEIWSKKLSVFVQLVYFPKQNLVEIKILVTLYYTKDWKSLTINSLFIIVWINLYVFYQQHYFLFCIF